MKPTKVNVFCTCFIAYSCTATALCYVYGDNHLGALSVTALVLLACCIQAARIVVQGLDKTHLKMIVFCCKAGVICVPVGMIILALLIMIFGGYLDFHPDNPVYTLHDMLLGGVDDILIFYSWPLWLFSKAYKAWILPDRLDRRKLNRVDWFCISFIVYSCVVTVLCYFYREDIDVLYVYTLLLCVCCIRMIHVLIKGLGGEELEGTMVVINALATGVPIGCIVLAKLFSLDPENPEYYDWYFGLVGGLETLLIFYSWSLLLFIFVYKKFILPSSE